MLGKDIDVLNMALLFAGDNMDHNILTIDGKDTFHGMGMIAALTAAQKNNQTLPRHTITEQNTVEMSKVAIHDYQTSLPRHHIHRTN